MAKDTLVVGVDMGNDAFKVIGPTKRELYILNLLSPWHERRIFSDDHKHPLNLLEVEVNTQNRLLGRFFVGGMAYKFNRGILKERTVSDRYSGKANDDQTLVILLTSIALSLLKPGKKLIKEKVIVGTMLPTEEYFSNGRENVKTLESKLLGQHNVKFLHPIFNDVEIEFEVVGVNVQPEGLCAINALMYDDESNLRADYEYKYADHNILGFDIGALTSDITVVNNFELRNFFGISKGTVDPLNRIVDYIKTEYKVTIPRHKVDNAIIRNEKLLIYGKEIPNFSEICRDFIVHEAKQLVDEFSSKAAASGIQLPDIGLLILCGGGSLLFKEVISKQLSKIPMIFSENAIMLNAIGAWKNANSLAKDLSEGTVLNYISGR